MLSKESKRMNTYSDYIHSLFKKQAKPKQVFRAMLSKKKKKKL